MELKASEHSYQSTAVAVAETAAIMVIGYELLSRMGNMERLGLATAKVGRAADHLPMIADVDILPHTHLSSSVSINAESKIALSLEPASPVSMPSEAASDVGFFVKSTRGRRGTDVEKQDRQAVLDIVRETIKTAGKNEVSTADLTEKTGLSKDTVRKYIGQWQEQGELPPIEYTYRTRKDAQQNRRDVFNAVANANADGLVELSRADVMTKSGVGPASFSHLTGLVNDGELTVRTDPQFGGLGGFFYARPDVTNLAPRIDFLKSLVGSSPGGAKNYNFAPEFENTVVKPLLEEGLIKKRAQPPFDYSLTPNAFVGITTGHIGFAQTPAGKRIVSSLREYQMAHPELPGMSAPQLGDVIGTTDALALPYIRGMRNEGAIRLVAAHPSATQKIYRAVDEPIPPSAMSRGPVQRTIYDALKEHQLRQPDTQGLTEAQVARLTGLSENKVSFGLERLGQFTTFETVPLPGTQVYQVVEGYGPRSAEKYLGLLKQPGLSSIETAMIKPFFVKYRAASNSVLSGIGSADLVMPAMPSTLISRLSKYADLAVDIEMHSLQDKGLVQASAKYPNLWSLRLK